MQFLTSSLLSTLFLGSLVSALPSKPEFSFEVATRSENVPASGTVASIETPRPIMAGMVNYCNKFHKVVEGDICFSVDQKYNITFDQLRTWNTALDAGCSNLILGQYVCVGVPARPSNALPNSILNCDGWYTVKSGDRCIDIAPQFNITLDQLYSYNPDIDSVCSNLFPGNGLCVKQL